MQSSGKSRMLSRMSEEVQDVRDPRIDLVKGLAILCVLMIHARPLADSAVHEYLINRAVPILLFLSVYPPLDSVKNLW